MIRVELFASLKEVAGESVIELPISTPVTVEEVYISLMAEFPKLERYRTIVLAAVNEEYVSWDTQVGSGDAVAFFPPVSGG